MSNKVLGIDSLVTIREWVKAKDNSLRTELQAQIGSPLVAATVSAMTDQTKVYVYTGSETGYTAGNWYYYNGSAWTSGGVYNSTALETDTTLTIAGMAADAKATGDEITHVKQDINGLQSSVVSLEKKYVAKSMTSSSESIVYDSTGIMLAQGDQIIIETKEATTYGIAYIQGGSTTLNIGAVGVYTLPADTAGELMIGHRSLNILIYFPEYNIVSVRGDSTAKAASQKLVEDVFDEVDVLGDSVTAVADELDDKYDRYKTTQATGLSLSDFSICPSQYTIVQYDGTDALQHGAITGNIFSKLVDGVTDITFNIHQKAAKIALATTSSKAIGFDVNATSGNVMLYTTSGATPLSGIYRNSDCPTINNDDTLRVLRDGTKIALYAVINGESVPVFADEWVDVYRTYETAATIEETDVGIGFVTNTSQRNDPIIYNVQKVVVNGDHFMPYDEVDGRLSALENGAGFNPLKVDLFMFMGQSNMAGRGTGSQAPEVIAEAGYEFRAISDPTKLYPIVEPFGLDENVENKIYDYLGGYKAKSGDMVPAFVNAYFAHTHVSIVGVSASEGGTRISLWQPNTARDTDALARYNAAVTWLTTNGYTIRHRYMLWCQGESNGDDGMSKADYKSAFSTFASTWFTRGIETIFLVKIGNYNGTGSQDYNTIMTAQNEICQTMQNVVMASTDFAGMKERGLMKDDFHYTQAAYNEVGTYSGINAALYVNTEKEPTMYDTQNGTLYFTHKN